MPRPKASASVREAALYTGLAGLAYFATARIGYALAIPHGIVTLWLPSGVMLGLLLLTERRLWPALVLGALVGSTASDSLSGYPVPLALAAAFANVTESVVAASVLRYRRDGTPSLESLRNVLELAVFAAVLSNAVTAWLGAFIFYYGFHHKSITESWFVWWVGDGLGMLVVAPVVLAWATVVRYRPHIALRGAAEAVLLFAALIAVAEIALGPNRTGSMRPLPYIVFPMLFWIALRFGPVGATTATLITAAIATGNASLGVGPFIVAGEPATNTALQVYMFLAVAALSSLIPAAALRERQLARRRAAEAEDRMRFASDAAGVGTWQLDLATGDEHWSDTQARLHDSDLGRFDGTVKAFLERVHPDDRGLMELEFAQARKKRTDANVVYRSIWSDGSVHWINTIGRTVYDSSGNPVRTAGIAIDVTERRTLEEQFRQAQKMDAVGQLAGGVAHDFNNLLTAIIATGSAMEADLAVDSPFRDGLAEMLRAADRAASLTRQLLAFSRKQIIEPRVFDLSDSVRTMEPLLRRLIGEHIDIDIRTKSQSGRIKADPGQIEQVILNLALNARDAMPERGSLLLEVVNVEIGEPYGRSHLDAPPGRYVLLAVTDTGIGMDSATSARVFEPFFTTKAVGRGTGLGLSMAYGIVEQSGGRILVYSEPGRGTTFKVYFPRVDEAADEGGIDQSEDDNERIETVLLAEDDDAVRKIVGRILAERGYRVLVAATPTEALAVAAAHAGRIDLVLTDVVMPEMSGRELADRLSRVRADLRVLYMSGYTDDAIVQRGVIAHDASFIQKPFSNEALLKKVSAVLRAATTPSSRGA